MDDSLARREAAGRPRRVSAAAEPGANASLQDGEVVEVQPAREAHAGADRLSAAAGRMERSYSALPGVHQRHMPMEPLKFHIPRKTKENRALFQYISTESREYEGMMTILSSSYIDTTSAGCFAYSSPRLVHSELLEKEFVEKRKEMKAEGRIEKELEESYCFLLTDTLKLHQLCEKGLFVGQSWITGLGNPGKGVYLSRYSDLLQVNPFTPGTTGEIIIFKVMKGKVKSIYENMKNLLDPTPRFDSHISKNASKVTSLTSYRALELTQQYFYEYSFDELRQRPRQVCPYAVVSFQVKGKDSPLPSKPLAPIRLNSQSSEGSKEHAQFTVWSGDLVKDEQVLFQISLRSFSPPLLPHRLPEKLEIGDLMRLDQVTKLLPSGLLSYNLYSSSSQEVVKNGHCCSLLEVIDRNRSTTSVTRLLQELEMKRVVLVTPLSERGFLFLLSSVHMATPTERGESWKRCLQALFVIPESRDVARSTPRCASSSHHASESLMSGATVMPWLSQFIPALHHSLVKARANPPPELSAGVEIQAREYLLGQNDGKVRQYLMGEYDSKLDEQVNLLPTPKHHRVNMDGYLHSYLYNPAHYLLSVARARQVMEAHCGPEQLQDERSRKIGGGQREATGTEAVHNTRDEQTNTQKVQQLIDLVVTCKRNAENEVRREEGDALKAPGRKRKFEQVTAERALKYLKASQEPGRHDKIPVEGSHVPSSPVSFASVIGSVGLRDVDLREDGAEVAIRLNSLLTGLTQAARGITNQSLCEAQEEGLRESCPFGRLATRLGLPTNCDIDLRKQEELEEQTAGSVSSLEGFSPGSHSGEMNHHGAAGRGGAGAAAAAAAAAAGGGGGGVVGGGGGLGWKAPGAFEEEEEQVEVPWVLIPITGLCSERYTQRDRNIPQDPRFQHLATATSITITTKPPRASPTPSPQPSPPPAPFQCTSPDPSPPISPSQCPSPELSPPPSPSQCPSPEPSPPPSPSQCPSPQSSLLPSSSQCRLLPPLSSRCQSLEPNEFNPLKKNQSGANEEHVAPTAFREFTGVSNDREEKPQGKDKKNEAPSISASIRPERRAITSPPHTAQVKEEAEWDAGNVKRVQAEVKEEKETWPAETVQKQGGKEAGECKQEVVDAIQEVTSEEEQKGKVVGGSVVSSSGSSAPACPHAGIDNIVDKHMGDFSSEVQLLLQGEKLHYSYPQPPCSTSNTEGSTPGPTRPYTSVSPFSQYVSFYNPCPPVQDYMSSLQDSISSMLTEFDGSCPSHKAYTSRTNADATLANKVSAFVASVRAANTKTGRDEEVSALCGELTADDGGASASQSPAASRGGEVRRPDAPPTSHVTLSVPTSASGSVYPTNTAVLGPPPNKSEWKSTQSHTLEITRTVTQNIKQTRDNGTTRTVLSTAGGEGGSSLAGTNCGGTLFSGVSKPSVEPSQHSEPVSSPSSISVPDLCTGPAPPATALSSLISQLKPEVFNNLVEIIKDVKRNSLQFHLHSTDPGDRVCEDVKERLLKQGHVEQNPLAFLSQDHSDNRLLVVIKNKDIAGHIHKIPGLMSLKRLSSVVFVGIDTLDDIKNNSYNELFVSGGCIVSDELVLNPDLVSYDRLASLLRLLEQHSSLESVWRWKIHCKTHKKLKEQARFRRDAANLLDMLSAYHKRQIVEFLPYHHCDMMNHQSPDLDCLIELQARYTQYRHTIFLTEHHFEKFPAYSSVGIVVAGIEEILHNFPRVVGCHNTKDKQPIIDDLLAPKGLGRQLSHGDSVSASERSPSIFTEHIHSLSSVNQPQHLPQPTFGLPSLPNLSDQLVPDTSCKDGVQHTSDTDYEVLRLAISQLRTERQMQLQQLQLQQQQLESQAEFSINPLISFLPNLVCAGGGHTTLPSGQGGPTDSVQISPGKNTVAATLELIHSALQSEVMKEERRKDRGEPPPKEQRRGGGPGGGESGDPRAGTPVKVVASQGGNRGPSDSKPTALSSNQNAAAVTGPSSRTAADERERKAHQQGEPAKHGVTSCGTTACSAEDDRSRDSLSRQVHPVRGEGAPPVKSTTSGAKVTGSITVATEGNKNPGLPRLQQTQQPHQQLQHPNDHPHLHHRGVGFMQHPHLPRLRNQPFSPGPMLGPLTALGGIRGLLGPMPVWPGGLGPRGNAALVWGFQQPGNNFAGPRLLGGYHSSAGQGGNRYRGGQRGGGFNGM